MPSVVVAQSIADIVSSLFRVGKIIEIDIASHSEGVPLDVEAAELQLSRTLQGGPQRINTEYIAHLRSDGPKFSSGDGTAQAALASILAQVQAVVDADFANKRHDGFQLSDLHDWNSVCFNVAKETVTTLAQLHQRLPRGGRILPSFDFSIPFNSPNIQHGTFTSGGSPWCCSSDEGLSRYTGLYLPGRVRHGRGLQVWGTGNRYDGIWISNKMHGEGIYTYANGDVYNGGWQNNQKHGRGCLTRADGEIYLGHWRSGFKAGYGMATCPDGSAYEGSWKNNLLCGFGFTILPSKERFEGDFDRGMANGYAVTTSLAGPMYKGQWNHGQRNGFGVEVSDDGEYYDGEWKDNLKHGSGVSIRLNGEKFEGNWENGELKTTRTL